MALTAFFNNPVNSVTRERLFFHKLYFDIKLAAVRANYPLSIFEPEVDRDKFDIVLDDGDNERRIQLKTFTKSSGTTQWTSSKRFMRPDMVSGDKLNIAPMDCGLGGGFILIEIDDSVDDAPVSYLYTDRSLISGLASGLLVDVSSAPTGRGRRPEARRTLAENLLAGLAGGDPHDPTQLHKKLFVRLKSPDALLSIAGLHSTLDSYLPSDHFLDAEIKGIEADQTGVAVSGADAMDVAIVHARMLDIVALLDEPALRVFSRSDI